MGTGVSGGDKAKTQEAHSPQDGKWGLQTGITCIPDGVEEGQVCSSWTCLERTQQQQCCSAHTVEGFLFDGTCTVTPSPALKAGTTFFLHFDWMISTDGRKAAASRGAAGWQQWVPGLPDSPVLGTPWSWQHNLSCCCDHQPAGTAASHKQGHTELLVNRHCSSGAAKAAVLQGSRKTEAVLSCRGVGVLWMGAGGCMVCPLSKITVLISQLQFLYPVVGVK